MMGRMVLSVMGIEDGDLRMGRPRRFLCLRLCWRRLRGTGESRFPIGESSKTLIYGPLWVAGKDGFLRQGRLGVRSVTMRGSPLTIQALTADSIYVANATV